MRKVLIWDKSLTLKDAGGPSGYLYNLKEYLKDNPCNQITFYSDVHPNIDKKIQGTEYKSFKQWFKNTSIGKIISYLGWFYYQRIPLTNEDLDLLSKFDYVHIHLVSVFLRSFRDYTGPAKIILTSHMPEPCVDEVMSICGYPNLLKHIPFLRNMFIRKEIKAYEAAYKIMFPVKTATEVYTENSFLYKEAFKKLGEKMFFVPTSIINSFDIKVDQSLLKDDGIPAENLRVCFIGRHNHVKGYDSLKRIAVECWKSIPQTTFVIGGKEEPLKGLVDYRWVEKGWVKTQSLLNEIDVFILPNKDTYFDLILLEVLRQGVPCIISRTGGNKHFEGVIPEGIRLYDYDNVNDAVKQIEYFRRAKLSDNLDNIRSKIKEYFKQNYTPGVYVSNYLKAIESF